MQPPHSGAEFLWVENRVPSTPRRLGRRWASAIEMAKRDASLRQVVGRQLERDAVAREDADMVLAHFSAGVGNELMPVANRTKRSTTL